MNKFSSILLVQFPTPLTGPSACSGSSLWRPKSGTLTENFFCGLTLLVVHEFVSANALPLVSLPGFHPWFSPPPLPFSICTLLQWCLCYVLCLTNAGLVQCFSLGSLQVCTLVFLVCPIQWCLCYVCFASQTPGLCSALSSTPVKFACLFLVCNIQ